MSLSPINPARSALSPPTESNSGAREEQPIDLGACQEVLGVDFSDPSLLFCALTHASSKSASHPSNERLEFLGDAILGVIISEHLYRTHPDCDEGELTRIKSIVVSTEMLARRSRSLNLDQYFRVGKGMANQESYPSSLHANVFEAIIAAVYLDAGLEAARSFVLSHFSDVVVAAVNHETPRNFKSMLQHHSQKRFNITPTYRVVSEKGPDHFKSFEVMVVLGKREFGTGWGRSKKEAEQRAAADTIRTLCENEELHLTGVDAWWEGEGDESDPDDGTEGPTGESER